MGPGYTNCFLYSCLPLEKNVSVQLENKFKRDIWLESMGSRTANYSVGKANVSECKSPPSRLLLPNYHDFKKHVSPKIQCNLLTWTVLI